jgi:hypothetical protein
MAKQTINIGSSPNKGDGDPLRDAFDKINDNFTELYTLTGGTTAELKELSQDYVSEMIVNATHSGISVAYNDTANTLALTGFSGAYADLTGAPSIPSDVSDLTDNTSLLFSGDYNDLTNKPSTDLSALAQNLTPATDATYDLGSNTLRFDDVYARKLRADGFVFFDEEIGGSGQVLSLLKASDNTVATLKADIVGYATETYVDAAVQALDDDLRVGVSTALDSLNELSAAINDDPNFATTVSSALALKADTSSLATVATSGSYTDLTNTPTALSDFTNNLDYAAIVGGAIQTNGLPVLPTQTLDISGSVFADDSTLLVDGVNGKIVGPYDNGVVSINPTNVTTYDIFVQQDANTNDLYVANRIYGGETGATTTLVIGSTTTIESDVNFNDVVKFAKTTSTGGANSGTATALDVTKTLQVLNSADGDDDFWTLADGTEGQIMHFVPGSGAGSNQHYVEIANWRRWDSDTSSWIVEQDLTWTPFKLDFDGTRWTGVATAIFANGAWQTSNPWID